MEDNKIYKAIKSRIKDDTVDIKSIYKSKDKYIFALYNLKYPDDVMMDNIYSIDFNLNINSIKPYNIIYNMDEFDDAIKNIVFYK